MTGSVDFNLDQKAQLIATHMNGWEIKDVAQVCAALCAQAIRQMPEEARPSALTDLKRLIDGVVDGSLVYDMGRAQ